MNCLRLCVQPSPKSQESQHVPAFATTGGEEDENLEAEKDQKEKTKNNKAKPVAGPDVELALKQVDPVVPPPEKGDGEKLTEYKPGGFSRARLDFIAQCKKSGSGFKEANQKWMLSSERAELLSSLPEKDLKRRRFC